MFNKQPFAIGKAGRKPKGPCWTLLDPWEGPTESGLVKGLPYEYVVCIICMDWSCKPYARPVKR